MEISEFRTALENFVGYGDQAILEDDVWWERFGDLLDDVLATRALARRAEREANQCTITRTGGVVRCVRTKNHTGNHFNPTTGQW